ncbi:unnamed protein product [marine sediment metagenome]|uniref:Uncharacterized protein n=1 Tax=marine sediment metagenome TaxID=412755 RepID=X1ARZ7_9ZZZZ
MYKKTPDKVDNEECLHKNYILVEFYNNMFQSDYRLSKYI